MMREKSASGNDGGSTRRSPRILVSLWLLLGLVLSAVAAPRTDAPGLYYDEAFLAQQAGDFFTPDRYPDHARSVRQIWVAGRPLPVRNALYLGSLKSLLAIPAFAVFGATPRVLRLNTLFWSWIAVGFAMLWAGRTWGVVAGGLTGLLLATDPAWYFFSLHEWGPFTTGLLCRTAGLWWCVTGWTRRSPWRIAAGAVALGLGIFNRADFVVIVAAAAVGLVCARPDVLLALWREQRRLAAIGAAALLTAASPMIFSAAGLFAMSSSDPMQQRGGLDEKLRVLWSVLDGSRYYRVIETGGLFERMFDAAVTAAAPWSPFGGIVILAAVAALALRLAGPGEPRRAGLLFVLVTGSLTVLGTLAVPGAVRAHHQLNAMPLPHLLVAAVATTVWSRFSGRAAVFVRGTVGVLLVWVLAANALAIARTYSLIERTGGRGRFSDAIHAFAEDVEAQQNARVVSMDWGFHEPLLFLTRETKLEQPIWRLPAAVGARGAWVRVGSETDLYLVYDPVYAAMGYSTLFLDAARAVAEARPGLVTIAPHRDREGGVSFWSVRFERPHRIRFTRGRFQIEWI